MDAKTLRSIQYLETTFHNLETLLADQILTSKQVAKLYGFAERIQSTSIDQLSGDDDVKKIRKTLVSRCNNVLDTLESYNSKMKSSEDFNIGSNSIHINFINTDVNNSLVLLETSAHLDILINKSFLNSIRDLQQLVEICSTQGLMVDMGMLDLLPSCCLVILHDVSFGSRITVTNNLLSSMNIKDRLNTLIFMHSHDFIAEWLFQSTTTNTITPTTHLIISEDGYMVHISLVRLDPTSGVYATIFYAPFYMYTVTKKVSPHFFSSFQNYLQYCSEHNPQMKEHWKFVSHIWYIGNKIGSSSGDINNVILKVIQSCSPHEAILEIVQTPRLLSPSPAESAPPALVQDRSVGATTIADDQLTLLVTQVSRHFCSEAAVVRKGRLATCRSSVGVRAPNGVNMISFVEPGAQLPVVTTKLLSPAFVALSGTQEDEQQEGGGGVEASNRLKKSRLDVNTQCCAVFDIVENIPGNFHENCTLFAFAVKYSHSDESPIELMISQDEDLSLHVTIFVPGLLGLLADTPLGSIHCNPRTSQISISKTENTPCSIDVLPRSGLVHQRLCVYRDMQGGRETDPARGGFGREADKGKEEDDVDHIYISALTADCSRVCTTWRCLHDTEVYKERGNHFMTLGDHFNAISEYTRSISCDHCNHVAYSNRCAAYLYENDLPHAFQDAERCVELSPAWSKGYARLGSVLYRYGRLDEAEVAYQKAVQWSEGQGQGQGEGVVQGLLKTLSVIRDEIASRDRIAAANAKSSNSNASGHGEKSKEDKKKSGCMIA